MYTVTSRTRIIQWLKISISFIINNNKMGFLIAFYQPWGTQRLSSGQIITFIIRCKIWNVTYKKRWLSLYRMLSFLWERLLLRKLTVRRLFTDYDYVTRPGLGMSELLSRTKSLLSVALDEQKKLWGNFQYSLIN